MFGKKKKGILPKNGGAVGPLSPVAYKEPPQPLRCSIEEAKNGYTINCSGGKAGYSSQPHIAESLDKALEVASKHLGGKKSGGKDEEKDEEKDEDA